jgi:hypothetical protein
MIKALLSLCKCGWSQPRHSPRDALPGQREGPRQQGCSRELPNDSSDLTASIVNFAAAFYSSRSPALEDWY